MAFWGFHHLAPGYKSLGIIFKQRLAEIRLQGSLVVPSSFRAGLYLELFPYPSSNLERYTYQDGFLSGSISPRSKRTWSISFGLFLHPPLIMSTVFVKGMSRPSKIIFRTFSRLKHKRLYFSFWINSSIFWRFCSNHSCSHSWLLPTKVFVHSQRIQGIFLLSVMTIVVIKQE